MTTWTSDELRKIESADELHIASLRPNGTLRSPVTIWVVRHGDDFYVRSVNGPGSGWFCGVEQRHEGDQLFYPRVAGGARPAGGSR